MGQSQTTTTKRLELQGILETIMGEHPVYFQPPSSIELTYPAIIYKRSSVKNLFADNVKYDRRTRYQITLIDRDPDSTYRDSIEQLPLCTFSQHFVSDSLNHDIYDIYF